MKHFESCDMLEKERAIGMAETYALTGVAHQIAYYYRPFVNKDSFLSKGSFQRRTIQTHLKNALRMYRGIWQHNPDRANGYIKQIVKLSLIMAGKV